MNSACDHFVSSLFLAPRKYDRSRSLQLVWFAHIVLAVTGKGVTAG
jgi:hypothetical protein